MTSKTYSPHYEVYLKMKEIGWIMAGWRDEENDAHEYGNEQVGYDSNVIGYKVKKKNFVDPIKL